MDSAESSSDPSTQENTSALLRLHENGLSGMSGRYAMTVVDLRMTVVESDWLGSATTITSESVMFSFNS